MAEPTTPDTRLTQALIKRLRSKADDLNSLVPSFIQGSTVVPADVVHDAVLDYRRAADQLKALADESSRLREALRNCYVLAVREARKEQAVDDARSSRWNHIKRFCKDADADGSITASNILREEPAVSAQTPHKIARCVNHGHFEPLCTACMEAVDGRTPKTATLTTAEERAQAFQLEVIRLRDEVADLTRALAAMTADAQHWKQHYEGMAQLAKMSRERLEAQLTALQEAVAQVRTWAEEGQRATARLMEAAIEHDAFHAEQSANRVFTDILARLPASPVETEQ